MILVDANVLSEATRSAPDPSVLRWLRRHERDLVVDPVVLGELRYGILLLPRGARRTRLERWFSETVQRIRCVSVAAETGLRWAELLAALRRKGRTMSVKDSLIAATALHNALPLATLNRRDFENAGVVLVEPRI